MSDDQSPFARAVALAASVETHFLELGRLLREIRDADQGEFQRLLKNTGLGTRKAYYLMEIEETFSKIPVQKKRLRKIGWSKLMLLSPHITKATYAELLKLAEANTAQNLKLILQGKPPMPDAKCLLLYLSPDDYEVVSDALVQFGAQKVGRALYGKEKALVRMAKRCLSGG